MSAVPSATGSGESSARILERQDLSPETFRSEVTDGYRPVVLRGLVRDWPAVRKGRESAESLIDYLRALDSGRPVYTVAADPGAGGRFFYGEGLRGVNFGRVNSPLASTLDLLLRMRNAPRPPAIAVQAGSVNEVLPGFGDDNRMALLDPACEATFWMGNRALVAPHFDAQDNIACVVAGRRRFTLYPPEQIRNLYTGPILDAPGGVPISTVDIRDPDFERFPRYREALAAAQTAVLEPGDALYIPAPWWHAVESLDSINLLVNYWFAGMNGSGISPKNSLLHSIMSLRGLPDKQRAAWGTFFDYFVFDARDPTSHWPDGIEDIVTAMSAEQKKIVLEMLRRSLGD